ncbi:MAG: LysR family transcriptional regulator [Clostridia bacterium]|nr:LysR family transcriptional regulator [Clostridia bacterium]
MDINYELYKMFYKVAKVGSFTRVAEENFISQSAVTQAMKKLENQLGGTLFIRAKTGVTLTPEGQTLFEYINDSLETLNSAENLFSKYKNLEKGKLRINCGSTLVETVMLKPLIKFAKDYPNINITIENGVSVNSIEKIANGQLDLSVFNFPIKNEYDNVKVEALSDADMCFFTNKNYYKKMAKKKFDFKDISKCCLALPAKGSNSRVWLDNNYEELGIVLNSQYEFSSGKVLINFVKNTETVGYANKDIVQKILKDDAVILANDFKVDRKEVGVAYLNEKITSAATLKFLQYLKEYNKVK